MDAKITKRDYVWMALAVIAIVSYMYADSFTYAYKKEDCIQINAHKIYNNDFNNLKNSYKRYVESYCIEVINKSVN